ncbi:hypothetical protein TNCV_3129731 [Trichonephila clavipes]|nr:hypothetical protein TNCV_3129731 [Trichonephila clavipes]
MANFVSVELGGEVPLRTHHADELMHIEVVEGQSPLVGIVKILKSGVPAQLSFSSLGMGLGSNPGDGIDVCKCVVPLWHGDTLNSHRSANPLVRLVEGEERWEAPGHL